MTDMTAATQPGDENLTVPLRRYLHAQRALQQELAAAHPTAPEIDHRRKELVTQLTAYRAALTHVHLTVPRLITEELHRQTSLLAASTPEHVATATEGLDLDRMADDGAPALQPRSTSTGQPVFADPERP